MTMLVEPGKLSEVKSKKDAEAESALAGILKDSPPGLGINKLRTKLKESGFNKGQEWVANARTRIRGSGVEMRG